MTSTTLLVSALLALGTGAGFAAIGRLMLKSSTRKDHAATVMFALFWFSAAIVWTTQGLTNLVAATGHLTFAIMNALGQVGDLFYCVAAAGLLYYVLFLLTGRQRILVPILVYYLVLFFLLRLQTEVARRLDVEVGRWVVTFVYETPLQSPTYTIIVLAIAGPVVGAIFAYASLLRHTPEPAKRYRIVLISMGLLIWIGMEAFSFTSGFSRTDAGEITRRLVALGSAFVILLAYRPPAFARRRWLAEASGR